MCSSVANLAEILILSRSTLFELCCGSRAFYSRPQEGSAAWQGWKHSSDPTRKNVIGHWHFCGMVIKLDSIVIMGIFSSTVHFIVTRLVVSGAN